MTLKSRSGVEHFWWPPLGETGLGMCVYQDMLVIATTGGVYVVVPPDRVGLDDHTITKVVAEFKK